MILIMKKTTNKQAKKQTKAVTLACVQTFDGPFSFEPALLKDTTELCRLNDFDFHSKSQLFQKAERSLLIFMCYHSLLVC